LKIWKKIQELSKTHNSPDNHHQLASITFHSYSHSILSVSLLQSEIIGVPQFATHLSWALWYFTLCQQLHQTWPTSKY